MLSPIDDIVRLAEIDDIVRLADRTDRHFLTRPLLPDPADHHMVETGVNGRADVLVTLNTRDLRPAARTYNFRLAVPGEALVLLMPKRM